MKQHTPVMVKEVIDYLNPKKGQKIIDCTVGLGGHAREIFKRIGATGQLLGIDQDYEGILEAKKNLSEFKNQIVFINENFNNLKAIAQENGFEKVDGVLFDLGVASWHFEESGRGFSFSKNEILDMRMDQNQKLKTKNQKYKNNKTAKYVINRYSLKELADILYKYGDIRKSRMIAERIIKARKIQKLRTTFDLIKAIEIKNPKVLAPIFQSIRIEVNQEYKNLKSGLVQSIDLLKSSGKLIVISFHSGEDRIVKNFFREKKKEKTLKILTKKPITASYAEIKNNPKSRSAKLRVAEKI